MLRQHIARMDQRVVLDGKGSRMEGGEGWVWVLRQVRVVRLLGACEVVTHAVASSYQADEHPSFQVAWEVAYLEVGVAWVAACQEGELGVDADEAWGCGERERRVVVACEVAAGTDVEVAADGIVVIAGMAAVVQVGLVLALDLVVAAWKRW